MSQSSSDIANIEERGEGSRWSTVWYIFLIFLFLGLTVSVVGLVIVAFKVSGDINDGDITEIDEHRADLLNGFAWASLIFLIITVLCNVGYVIYRMSSNKVFNASETNEDVARTLIGAQQRFKSGELQASDDTVSARQLHELLQQTDQTLTRATQPRRSGVPVSAGQISRVVPPQSSTPVMQSPRSAQSSTPFQASGPTLSASQISRVVPDDSPFESTPVERPVSSTRKENVRQELERDLASGDTDRIINNESLISCLASISK